MTLDPSHPLHVILIAMLACVGWRLMSGLLDWIKGLIK